jgi:hypothetical protein
MFARMLDTVPRGVELTEVITPVPIKPANVQLVLAKDKLKFSGQVRVSSRVSPLHTLVGKAIKCTHAALEYARGPHTAGSSAVG